MKITGAGPDKLHPSHVKLVAPFITDSLAHIINLMFKSGCFPNELKQGRITPVFKKGDRCLISNYCPICVLPFFSKVIEKLIEKRLTNYFKKFNILSPIQYGFRPGYSTELALIALTDELRLAIDEGNYAASVFIDFTKAFEKINHKILSYKLESLGITGPALLLLQNYLKDRMQVITISGVNSKTVLTNIGVPQGSILGPLLFLLYVNDLPNCLSFSKCILYADDTTVINSDKCLTTLTSNINRHAQFARMVQN